MSKLEITVCMGSSCYVRGNDRNLEYIENYMKYYNMEADIDLAGERCSGKCASGPNMIINGVEYNEVDEYKLKEILDKYRESKQ